MLPLTRSLRGLALLAVAFAFAAAPAAAQLFSFSGATEPSDPTFQRPFTIGDGTPGSCSLSSIGSDVPYDTYTFTPAEDVQVDITVTFGTDEDGYLFLYEGAFDPNNQCLNLVDLDSGLSGVSEIEDVMLMGGTDYIIVVSSYRDGEFVTYSGVVTEDVPPVVVFNFGGDTTGDPTFNRPSTVGDGTAGSCTLSGVGTAVSYEATAFTPDRDSQYAIETDYADGFDGYLLLYEGPFDPTMPCVNLIALDDDFGGATGGGSRIEDVMLMGGTTYTIVVTGFDNLDAGAYTGFVEDLMPAMGGDSAVDIEATATSPLTVSPGGFVTFNYTVTNDSSDAVTGDVYYTAEFNGNQVDQGVIISGGPLASGGSATGSYTQLVPEDAPAGDYTYCVRVGIFPNNPQDSDCFTVTVTGSQRPAVLARLEALRLEAEQSGDKSAYLAAREALSEEAELALAGMTWAVTEVSPWEATGTTVTNAPTDAAGVYPNPFAGSAQIAFALDATADVRLAVYDVLGREVAVLVDAELDAGSHSAAFDAAGLPTGTYLYRLRVGGAVQTGQLSLVK